MKNLRRAAAFVCAVLAANALTAVSSAAEDKITYPENWGRVTDTPADAVAWITGTDYLLLKRNRISMKTISKRMNKEKGAIKCVKIPIMN